jgi:hypothetical protein
MKALQELNDQVKQMSEQMEKMLEMHERGNKEEE